MSETNIAKGPAPFSRITGGYFDPKRETALFLHHPLDTENFDINTFVSDNHVLLHTLFSNIQNKLDDSTGPNCAESTDLATVSLLMVCSIFNDEIDPEFPIGTYEDEEEETLIFTQQLYPIVVMLSIEQDNIASFDRESCTWSLTEEGRQKLKKLKEESNKEVEEFFKQRVK